MITFNREHLDYLEAYIFATLRLPMTGTPPDFISHSLSHSKECSANQSHL